MIVAAGHTAARYEILEEAVRQGLRGYTHLFNAMPPLMGREPGPVGAALDQAETWVSLIVDLQHVSAPSLRIALAAKPLDKVILITDAMPSVGSGLEAFSIQGRTVYRRNGRLETEEGTLAGADLDMATAVRNTHRHLGIDLEHSARNGVARSGRFPSARSTNWAASRPAIARTWCSSMRSWRCVRPGSREWRSVSNEGRGTRMTAAKRVLVVGLGNMGMSHARAYARIDGFEVAAVCERNIAERKLPQEIAAATRFADFGEALAKVKPDIVSINTWADTHADYAIRAMYAGAHVFVEKPLAETVEDAERVVAAARRTGRKLVVGYILRHHPSWTRFIEIANTLGSPLVFRMNLNQQSSGAAWESHKRLLHSLSPIVDCGVHYLDVMCQITRADAGQGACARRAPHRRHAAGHVQLRAAAGFVRGRLGRLVRVRLGADDERDRLFREGRDRAARLGLDRHAGDGPRARSPPTSPPQRRPTAFCCTMRR